MSNQLPLEELQDIRDRLNGIMPENETSQVEEVLEHAENMMENMENMYGNSPIYIDAHGDLKEFIAHAVPFLNNYKNELDRNINKIKSNIMSITLLCTDSNGQIDAFVFNIRRKIVDLTASLSPIDEDVLENYSRIYTIDQIRTSIIEEVEESLQVVEELKDIMDELISHLQRVDSYKTSRSSKTPDGEKVFISHGKSPEWRELDQDLKKLGIETDEFNRETPTGEITSRLLEMLDDAALAVVVLTGEIEGADGKFYPRLNVVHELGMCHVRLGADRTIILLEDGCEIFSNINGINHHPFPKGHIQSALASVLEICRRHGLPR